MLRRGRCLFPTHFVHHPYTGQEHRRHLQDLQGYTSKPLRIVDRENRQHTHWLPCGNHRSVLHPQMWAAVRIACEQDGRPIPFCIRSCPCRCTRSRRHRMCCILRLAHRQTAAEWPKKVARVSTRVILLVEYTLGFTLRRLIFSLAS